MKMTLKTSSLQLALTATMLAAGTSPATAADLKPAWLTDLSAAVKESYDDNVFLAGADHGFLPGGYAVPQGSVAALKDHSSWVTTISPKLGVDLAPLLGGGETLRTLSLAYAPDFAIYHDAPSESYDAHKFAASLKARADAFSFNLDNGFTYIQGSRLGPYYPGALFSAWGIPAPRERREQVQDRAAATVQFDQEQWFVRATGSLLDYDLMTVLQNISGYMNFCSRYDLNGGADFGYKVTPALALTLGYRYGQQYQQQFSFTPYSSSSDYQRALLGLEGKPWKWLDVKFQAGPDFRNYAGDTATHITPVDNLHPVMYYGEGALTATISDRDTATFKYKQWQWVSSIGKVPYFDSCFDLGYRRKLTKQLTADLGAKVAAADYTSGNLATCQRNDLEYSFSAGLGYAFTSHASASLTYSRDLGRNAQDALANAQIREFDRDLVSLGALFKF